MSIRSSNVRTALIALLAAGVVATLIVLLFPSSGTTAAAQSAGSLVRIAALYDMSGEASTDTESGVQLINRTVIPPSNANTLYITFSGTGDSHDGAGTRLGCRVDGHGCPNDDKLWTVVQKYDFAEFFADNPGLTQCNGPGGGGCGDWHDNNINLQWCQTILPGSGHKNVQVWLSSDTEGEDVFIEDVTFYIDASFTPHGCREISMAAGAAGHGG